MRNYNSKSFVKPVTQNSFKKSDRKYPESKRIERNEPSLQNPAIQCQPHSKNKVSAQSNLQTVVAANIPDGQYRQRYHVMLQNPFPLNDRNSSETYTQTTCLWFKNIRKTPSKTSMQIRFKGTQYIVGNWTGDLYPHIIFITADGFWGYMDENGKVTNRVLGLRLRQIQPVMTAEQIQVFELRYSSIEETVWTIPPDLTHIKLGLKVDDSADQMELPLPNPLVLEFQIKECKQK